MLPHTNLFGFFEMHSIMGFKLEKNSSDLILRVYSDLIFSNPLNVV